MKKLIYALLFIYLCFATNALALSIDSYVADSDILPLSDINALYWAGNDQNPSSDGQLVNANPTTEEAWLEALLGLVYNDSSINYIGRINTPAGVELPAYIGSPGFSWDYAVVKYGNYWAAYEDTGNDDFLTTLTNQNGVSHVTFFGPGQQVPEPAILLLLGSSLIGLAVFKRKFIKK